MAVSGPKKTSAKRHQFPLISAAIKDRVIFKPEWQWLGHSAF
jgi:hypothetical protein